MRFLELHEEVADTLRDVVENYLQTARQLLEEKPALFSAEQEEVLRWAISDAERVLSDLGEPCDCCSDGTYTNPDDIGYCTGCQHIPEQHEEYSGPTGSEADITS